MQHILMFLFLRMGLLGEFKRRLLKPGLKRWMFLTRCNSARENGDLNLRSLESLEKCRGSIRKNRDS